MDKEFIPYDRALALKELGFDEECLNYYFKVYKENVIQLWKGTNKLPDVFFPIVNAPLYQQAFRWFRKKYQIVFCYEPCLKKDLTYIFFIYVEVTGEKVFVVESKYNEEAELACIDKLIEIVKQK
jgi:hypothetical protein